MIGGGYGAVAPLRSEVFLMATGSTMARFESTVMCPIPCAIEGLANRDDSARARRRARCYRVLGVLAGLLLYVSADWTALRHGVALSVQMLLAAASVPSELLTNGNGDISLMTSTGLFVITSACTYIDLILMLAPLSWRQHRSWQSNVRMIVLCALIVLAINTARIVAALLFFSLGASWVMAHTAPDLVIYFSILTRFIVSALSADGPAQEQAIA
jgi:hypothetical protein